MCETAACVDELGWVEFGEFGVEGGEDAGDAGPRPGAESEPAVLGVEVFHDGTSWCPAGHDVSGQVEPGGAGALPGGGGVAAVVGGHHEVGEVVVGKRAGGEMLGGGAVVQSVDALHSPLAVGEVVGDQVPPGCPDDQVMGLDVVGGQEVGVAGFGACAVGTQYLRDE